MVSIGSLWLPILLSAIVVFIISSIIHMVLKYHAGDYKQLPDENAVLDALRKFNLPPGDYMFPRPKDMQDMKSNEFRDKFSKGPTGLMTIYPSDPPNMGSNLAQWFIYCIIVGIFSAYISGRALMPGAPYLEVFRFAGATAFVGYGVALMQNSIWYRRSWGTTLKILFDSLIYALFTGGVFGWLWPGLTM
jgi:hypothetical protein